MPAQHHRGDLRRIGQVIDSRFDHFDPGDRQPRIEFVLQPIVDLLAAGTQRHFVGRLVVIVGVLPGQTPQRRIALHADEILVSGHPRRQRLALLHGDHAAFHRNRPDAGRFLAVDLEHRFISILHPPYQHEPDHHRIAGLVIHLDRLDVEVAGPVRHFFLRVERIHPPKTVVVQRPFVDPEKKHYARLVRLDHHKSRKTQHEQ